MPHLEQALRQLPRAAAQIERARRMLGLLVRYHGDGLLFPDLLAYVLELLLSVSRMINEESKGRRTATFTDWWASEPLADRKNIERLRHTGLKQGKRLSAQRYKTVANAQPADFPDLLVNAGDSVSTMTWFWQDGAVRPGAGDGDGADLSGQVAGCACGGGAPARPLMRPRALLPAPRAAGPAGCG